VEIIDCRGPFSFLCIRRNESLDLSPRSINFPGMMLLPDVFACPDMAPILIPIKVFRSLRTYTERVQLKGRKDLYSKLSQHANVLTDNSFPVSSMDRIVTVALILHERPVRFSGEVSYYRGLKDLIWAKTFGYINARTFDRLAAYCYNSYEQLATDKGYSAFMPTFRYRVSNRLSLCTGCSESSAASKFVRDAVARSIHSVLKPFFVVSNTLSSNIVVSGDVPLSISN